ncbi:glycosyltransferase family 25 protein [Paraburkholderia sp. CNPSo 3076]|uniref:glycosyltransferase family 25 protein n=1 Tax=Paraburkholderia sp. CNPSo 3076 TaxID=2940936 RepID=UPI0022525A49|nr:glycosyltransferase family 25 protein [Paraburkholderia sp. CNPSo 3076]MCX5544995.1 glycosyltransferase family 25 protein [Paraburkholderia sp. CNPSo 3076]
MAARFPVMIVSLARSGRRERIAEVMSRYGVDFSFIDAIDARRFESDELARLYDDSAARSRYRRALTRGEVACFLSHRLLWQRVVSGGRSVIVLEDDALLDHAFFAKVLTWPEGPLARIADVVLLGRSKLSRSSAARAYLYEPLKRAKRIDGMRIGTPFKQWTSGSVGYWISPRGAMLALAHTEGPVRALLDDWPWHRDDGAMIIKELRPYVVWEAFESLASDLEGERIRLAPTRARWRDCLLEPLRTVRLIARWTVAAVIRLVESAGGSGKRHGGAQ